MAAMEPLLLPNAVLGDTTDFFSESYEEARHKFRQAATKVTSEVHSLKVAEDSEGSYTMDIAVVRGKGHGLVVVSSGVHGVEGYAGSAIQIVLLKTLKTRPVNATVVLVHAVNPYGMAHFRRWNENNVDLNRNALECHHFEKLVNSDKLNDTYKSFSSMFNPERACSSCYAKFGVWFHMVSYIAWYGLKALKTALVAATYREEKGVFFGGRDLQPSHALLRDFMKNHFSDVNASDVAWIDVHTGLGPCGIDVLLGSSKDASEMKELFPKIAGEFDGFQSFAKPSTDETIEMRCSGNVSVNSRGEVSQSAGYEYTVGEMRHEWVDQFFKPGSGHSLVVTQEFGTLSNVKVARALMLENAGYHYDRKNHKYWRAFTRDAFYVRTEPWKKSVLQRGESVFSKVAARFA